MRVVVAVVLAALCIGAGALATATAPSEILTTPRVGYGGRARMGAWTPVWIDVTAPASGLEGTVAVAVASSAGSPAGPAVVRYSTPVRAAPGALVRIFIPAIFYDARAPGMVELDQGGRRVASRAIPRLRPVEEIIIALSSEPLGAEDVAARAERVEIAYLAPEDLPPVWQAYEGVRLLVIRNLDERRLDDAQRQAIQRWVWTGGRLLAMPSSDDTRHLQGPTLASLLPGLITPRSAATAQGPSIITLTPRPGSERFGGAAARGLRWRQGRGQVVLWDRDGADPLTRGEPAAVRAWEEALAGGLPPSPSDLEPTLAPLRPVPVRTQVLVTVAVLAYLLVVRWLSRLAAAMRPAALVVVAISVLVATITAVRVAAVARRDASGVVASVVVTTLAGTGSGFAHMLVRTVTSHGSDFALQVSGNLLLRPAPASGVVVEYGKETIVRGSGGGLRLAGTGVVPVSITGSVERQPAGDVAVVTNRSGVRVEKAWIFNSGRVQPITDIGADARLPLDAQRWQARDRLQRTEPNHQLLLWAFSMLESDAILKATPTWLVGWLRDPALGLRWGNRSELIHVLVLVPLTAR